MTERLDEDNLEKKIDRHTRTRDISEVMANSVEGKLKVLSREGLWAIIREIISSYQTTGDTQLLLKITDLELRNRRLADTKLNLTSELARLKSEWERSNGRYDRVNKALIKRDQEIQSLGIELDEKEARLGKAEREAEQLKQQLENVGHQYEVQGREAARRELEYNQNQEHRESEFDRLFAREKKRREALIDDFEARIKALERLRQAEYSKYKDEREQQAEVWQTRLVEREQELRKGHERELDEQRQQAGRRESQVREQVTEAQASLKATQEELAKVSQERSLLNLKAEQLPVLEAKLREEQAERRDQQLKLEELERQRQRDAEAHQSLVATVQQQAAQELVRVRTYYERERETQAKGFDDERKQLVEAHQQALKALEGRYQGWADELKSERESEHKSAQAELREAHEAHKHELEGMERRFQEMIEQRDQALTQLRGDLESKQESVSQLQGQIADKQRDMETARTEQLRERERYQRDLEEAQKAQLSAAETYEGQREAMEQEHAARRASLIQEFEDNQRVLLEQSQAEIERLMTLCEGRLKELEALRGHYDALREQKDAAITELREQLQQKRAKSEELQFELNRKSSEAEREREQLIRENEQLKELMDHSRQEFEKNYQALKTAHEDEWMSLQETHKKQFDDLKRDSEAASEQREAGFKRQRAELEKSYSADIERVRGDLTQQRERLRELEQVKQRLEREHRQAESEWQHTKRQAEQELQASKREQAEALEVFKQKNEQLEAEQQRRLLEQQEAYEEKLQVQKAQLRSEHKSEILELRAELAGQVKAYEAQLEDSRELARSQDQRLSELDEKLLKSKEKRAQLQGQLEHTESLNGLLNKRNDELRRKWENADEKIQDGLLRIRDLEGELKALESDTQKTIESQRKMIRKLKSELAFAFAFDKNFDYGAMAEIAERVTGELKSQGRDTGFVDVIQKQLLINEQQFQGLMSRCSKKGAKMRELVDIQAVTKVRMALRKVLETLKV